MLALYLSVLDNRSFEEEFTEVYNTYKRLVYHTAYKIMDDSYLAEDVLQIIPARLSQRKAAQNGRL